MAYGIKKNGEMSFLWC